MVIVDKDTVSDLVKHFPPGGFYGFDTETYGKDFGDRLFSLILANEKEEYYLNFNEAPDISLNYVLPRSVLPSLQGLFYGDRVWCAHNAKFDIQKLGLEGLRMWEGNYHCTQVAERLIRNDRMKYDLGTVAGIYGYAKDDAVEKYISKNHLYEMVHVPDKNRKDKKKFFNKVPFDLIVPYGCMDAKVTREIGVKQREILNAL